MNNKQNITILCHKILSRYSRELFREFFSVCACTIERCRWWSNQNISRRTSTSLVVVPNVENVNAAFFELKVSVTDHLRRGYFEMFYYCVVIALSIGVGYLWARKKYGPNVFGAQWRPIAHQWAVYRRRLLKRTRSQTPPRSNTISALDQVPLIVNERLDNDSDQLYLRSVTTIAAPNVASTGLGGYSQPFNSQNVIGLGSGGTGGGFGGGGPTAPNNNNNNVRIMWVVSSSWGTGREQSRALIAR